MPLRQEWAGLAGPGRAVVAACLLFGAVFWLRVEVEEVDAAITFLFCLPIALLAIRFGLVGGLAGAAVASVLLLAWSAVRGDVELGLLGYGARISTYVLLGGLVGLYVTRSAAALVAAREAALETEAILASTTDAVYRLDRAGRCMYANPATTDILGWAPEELRGADFHALVHHSQLDGTPYPREQSPLCATLQDGRARRGNPGDEPEVFWHKDGRPVAVDYTVAAITNGDGVGGAVVTARDVSERRYERDRLRSYAEQLVAAEAARASAGDRTTSGNGRPDPSADREGAIGSSGDPMREALELARERLGMDIAFVGRFEDGEETFPAVAGDAESFDLRPIALQDSYCGRMAAGTLPNIVADAKHDERVNGLAVTTDANIGAYLGVPIRLSDGRLYGALCSMSHDSEPSLDDRDVRFMEVLSVLLARELERRELDEQRRRLQRERDHVYTQASHVRALIAALEIRDEYTGTHSESVVALACDVTRRLQLGPDVMRQVEQTALLHDIGKVGVPDTILQKPGKLDDLEWHIMRQHPAIGARLIESVEPLAHLAPAIRAEHERWDGNGYPDGLAGERIPIAARIGFACDACHAMTSDRPYRRALAPHEARAELRRNAGTQFDPQVVAALVEILDESQPS